MNYELEEYQKFYEYFKKNTITDFCNAGIKAEIIIDTLITPYVADLVRCGLEQNNANDWKLLAKEFPIYQTQEKKGNEIRLKENFRDSLDNCKIDYLITDGKNLYFVELKTTKTSEDDLQKKNYLYYIEKEVYPYECFYRILCEKLKLYLFGSNKSDKRWNKIDEGRLSQKRDFTPINLKGAEKYISTVIRLLGEDWKNEINNISDGVKVKTDKQEVIKDAFKEVLPKINEGENEIKLVYLTLYKPDEPQNKKIKYIFWDEVINEYIKNQSRDKTFDMVKEILDVLKYNVKDEDSFVGYLQQ